MVIDDLAHFFSPRGDTFLRTVLRGAWAKLYQLWGGHRAVISIHGVCFTFQISCSISKRWRLKFPPVKN